MQYLEVDEARDLPGLRLVLSKGFPGPWGQAVKKMLEYKGISYIPVAQYAGMPNEALVAWTGIRNAPTIVMDDQAPISRWADQILFAEGHTENPPLLPKASADRATVFGIINELAGDWGLGWCRRLEMFDESNENERNNPIRQTLETQYGYQPDIARAARERVIDILHMLSSRLHEQRRLGSDYLVGNSPTAADIYWAAFSMMIEPLPDRLAPMTEELRLSRSPHDPQMIAAKDPILIEHRMRMFDEHLGAIDF